MSYDKKITKNESTTATTGVEVLANGPFFDTLEDNKKHYPKYMNKRECILVRSHSTGWVGYLPIDEIEIEQIYKTPCTSAILRYLGVSEWNKSKYIEDCVEALESVGWIIESVEFSADTIGKLKKVISTVRTSSLAEYYMVTTFGHILLLGNRGETVCDTSRKLRDSRKVYTVHSVIAKARLDHKTNLSYEMSKLEK